MNFLKGYRSPKFHKMGERKAKHDMVLYHLESKF